MVEEFYVWALDLLNLFLNHWKCIAAVQLAKNNKSVSGSKHIDIKYSVMGEHVQENKVSIERISTEWDFDPILWFCF